MAEKLLYRSERLVLLEEPGQAEVHFVELRQVDGQLVPHRGKETATPLTREEEPLYAEGGEICYQTESLVVTCVNGTEKITTTWTYYCDGVWSGERTEWHWGAPCE